MHDALNAFQMMKYREVDLMLTSTSTHVKNKTATQEYNSLEKELLLLRIAEHPRQSTRRKPDEIIHE